ncbi:hypothetical protein AB5I41_26380 [Sphingomonas sp. MMS24-JH45]
MIGAGDALALTIQESGAPASCPRPPPAPTRRPRAGRVGRRRRPCSGADRGGVRPRRVARRHDRRSRPPDRWG